ncbi:hypothetical protein V2J09_012053 [Rumex salicifolius]
MGKKDADIKEPEKKEVSGGGGGGVTVVLKVDLHCEGCAQKVKKTIKHLDVKEKVEKRIKKKVDLVSPQPPPKNDKENAGGKNSDEKPEKKSPPADDNKKAEQKKPKEAAVTTVVLKTKVNVDLAKDQVTVKGTMNMTQILPYLNTKLKRLVETAPPPPSKKDEGGNKKSKDKSGGGGGDKKGKGVANEEDKKNKKKSDETTSKGGGGEGGSKAVEEEENVSKIEVVNKMEYFGYPNGYGAHSYNPQQAQESGYVAEYWNGPNYMNTPPDYMNAPPQYLHAPQMFSDENPNACSIM